jgi:hypothetical protein
VSELEISHKSKLRDWRARYVVLSGAEVRGRIFGREGVIESGVW